MQSHAGRVVILGTGGTIAGTAASAADNIGYRSAQLGVAALVAAVPALETLALESEQLAQIDSKDMDFETWQRLAQRAAHHLARDDVAGVVVTHGTDTLEETAWFLQAVLNPAKPVVITCAMRPATALTPDGPQNLLDAVAVASTPGARGVVAVCAGAIHSALDVRKVHTYRADAFGSGDAGVLGYVEEGVVRQVRPWPDVPVATRLEALPEAVDWPRVEIVMSHAGASGGVVQALVAQGVHGLVVAATGNGTIHRDLEAALRKAQEGGVRVVRATRCDTGRVLPSPGDAIAGAGSLSPVKARIALMLELMG